VKSTPSLQVPHGYIAILHQMNVKCGLNPHIYEFFVGSHILSRAMRDFYENYLSMMSYSGHRSTRTCWSISPHTTTCGFTPSTVPIWLPPHHPSHTITVSLQTPASLGSPCPAASGILIHLKGSTSLTNYVHSRLVSGRGHASQSEISERCEWPSSPVVIGNCTVLPLFPS